MDSLDYSNLLTIRTVRLVEEFCSPTSSVRENPRRNSENEGFLWNDKDQNLAECTAESQKNEFQADYDRRCIQRLNGVIESQRGENNIGNFVILMRQLFEQYRELREAHIKSLNEMEELKRFQRSTFDTFSNEKIDRKSRHYP